MYELVYILPVDYDKKKLGTASSKVKKIINDRNGALVKEDFIGERLLQYPIKGHERGNYYQIVFTIPVDHLQELKKDLNLNKEIVRYLITKKEEEELKAEETEEKEKKDKKLKSSKTSKKEYSIVKKKEEIEKDEKKEEKAKLEDIDKKLDEILK